MVPLLNVLSSLFIISWNELLKSYYIQINQIYFLLFCMKSIQYLRIAFLQSVLAILGSLYFSNFWDPIANIVHGNFFGWPAFEPCHLCRWARILMYPLVLISGIALIRKDEKAAYTILPFSIAWVVLTTYHYAIQYLNSLNVFSCAPGNPCTTIDRSVWWFITIPALAWIAFVVISISCLMLIVKNRKPL